MRERKKLSFLIFTTLLAFFLSVSSEADATRAYHKGKLKYFSELKNIAYRIDIQRTLSCLAEDGTTKEIYVYPKIIDKETIDRRINAYATKLIRDSEHSQHIQLLQHDNDRKVIRKEHENTMVYEFKVSISQRPESSCSENELILSTTISKNATFCDENCKFSSSAMPKIFFSTKEDAEKHITFRIMEYFKHNIRSTDDYIFNYNVRQKDR